MSEDAADAEVQVALTDEELDAARAYRERYESELSDVRALAPAPAGLSPLELNQIADQVVLGLISPEARALVIAHEVGSRAAYEKRYQSPLWPGAQSGVTIGIGYDIGHATRDDFLAAWRDRLPQEVLERLAQTCGVKGEAARALPAGLKDIKVSWDDAEAVFNASTAPIYGRLVLRHLPNAMELHPHCFGALFSLVYNRGASFANAGPRFEEMRNILAHMRSRAFHQIPAELRAMKRLWQGQSVAGLLKRREDEAALFQRGVQPARAITAPVAEVEAAAPGPESAPAAEGVPPVAPEPAPSEMVAPEMSEAPEPLPALAPVPVVPPPAPQAAIPIPIIPESLTPADPEPPLGPMPLPEAMPDPFATRGLRRLRIAPEADENWFEHERSVERGLVVPPATRGGARFKPDDVGWSGDAENPEYCHLDGSLGAREFAFGPKELELIIRASRFEPSRSSGVILFGIRGAELVGGSQLNKDSIRLRDVRPDHRTFRCVIGAYHVGRQQVSAFTGSTVPNTNAVYTNWARHQSGAAPYGNMLLSGCYRYRVGTHVGTHEVPGAFRLQEDAEVVVLRSNADVTYDTGDMFDPCVPHDNLHPALRSMSFSSAGCQTVRGTYNAEQGHTGEWAELRKAVGLKGAADNGKRFDYVLVTGLEAAIASRTLADAATARDEAAIRARLTRLRYGSRGAEVSALQAALTRPVTGFLDAGDRMALIELQRRKLGFADGTFGPDMDARLGLGVFAAVEAVAAAPVRSLAAAAAERIALVIGNGAYLSAGARLANPPNDAEAIAGELDKLGFKVTRLIDKTRAEMADAISTFIERLDNPQVNAEAGLIFYAGHGVQIDGENYLLPVDCSPRSVATLVDSAIGLDAIIRGLENSKKAGLIFLDCCRNNPFPKATRALGGGLAGIDAPAGTFIAYATAPGSVALDGEDTPNSPFTSSLIAHVPAEGLSVSQLMIRVRRDVFQKSGGQQMPWDSSSLLVDLSLNPTPVTRSRQKPVSPEDLAKRRREEAATKEAEAWELTSRSNSEQLLRSFITMYPYSRHRPDAARRLRWLRVKDRFFWTATAAAVVFLLVVALGVVQWFRFEKTAADNVDLIGGDVGVVLADLKLNPVDTSLPWCRLRCVLSPFTCKAYTYHHASKRCFIKNDTLFSLTGEAAQGSTSAYLWGHKAPAPSPFKIHWNRMFESGDTILPSGEDAPVAVQAPRDKEEAKLDADYNAWGKSVVDLAGPWKGNAGIVCQRLCVEQEKCVGFTFNAVFERCRLFRWIRQDDAGNPRLLVVPHYSQPDETSRMKLNVPLVFSGIYTQRNK